eukprot:2071396-Lingulodinium_polyedra.AAC.1
MSKELRRLPNLAYLSCSGLRDSTTWSQILASSCPMHNKIKQLVGNNWVCCQQILDCEPVEPPWVEELNNGA